MKTKVWLNIAVILITTIGLYILSLKNFLLFHSIVEIYTVAIAVGIFIVVWNTKKYSKNESFIFLGIIYLLVGIIDFFHTFAYKGIDLLGENPDYATQLWIIGRLIESTGILIFAYYSNIKKQISLKRLSTIYILITVFLFLSAIVFDIFPQCFIEGVGQTNFKIISEYIICLILLIALLIFIRNEKKYDAYLYNFIKISIIFTIISELFFTLYTDVYGLTNVIGHLFKVWSFYLIYRSVIANSLQRPVAVIYRELDQSLKKISMYLDIAGSIIIVINKDKKVEVINRTGENILGCSKNEIIGKNWFENFVAENEIENQMLFFEDYIKVKDSGYDYIEYSVKSESKCNRMIHWHITKIITNGNETEGMLMSGIDITNTIEYENNLKKEKKLLRMHLKQKINY